MTRWITAAIISYVILGYLAVREDFAARPKDRRPYTRNPTASAVVYRGATWFFEPLQVARAAARSGFAHRWLGGMAATALRLAIATLLVGGLSLLVHRIRPF